jgi:hypothetical protein
MQVLVSVFNRPVDQKVKPSGPPGPGTRFVFSLDLQLEELDGITQTQQHVGTYSGVVTVLRNPKTSGKFFVVGGYLIQYESTYQFNAVTNTLLQAGQITEQGVLLFDKNINVLQPKEFAITGGTGPYARARGRITAPGEMGGDSNIRLLDIQL